VLTHRLQQRNGVLPMFISENKFKIPETDFELKGSPHGG
jgi:hypothetical protein